MEEQALARIHRIGQTKEVTTVCFYVRDSFEQVSYSDSSQSAISDTAAESYGGARVEKTFS